MKTLLLILASAALLADELRTYTGRIDYTSRGKCDCFYLTLSEKRGWGKMTKDPQPHDGERLIFDWLGDKDQDLVVRPAYGPDGWWPERSVRLVRGATAKELTSFKRPERPNVSSVINLEEFYHLPELPGPEVALFRLDPKTRISTLWPFSDDRFAWGFSVKPHLKLADRFIEKPSNDGEFLIAVYDVKTREPLIRIDATYRHFSHGGFMKLATWVDGRYLILPATLRQEIVYVCDLESKRIP